VENLDPATVPDRDHAALRASGQCLVGLDIAHQQAISPAGKGWSVSQLAHR